MMKSTNTMKNIKRSFFAILSTCAVVISCTDLEEELVGDFTENLTVPEYPWT